MLRGWPQASEGILEVRAPPRVAEEGALLTWPSKVQLHSSAAETSPSVSMLLLSFRRPAEAAPPERSKDRLESKKNRSGSCFPLAQSKPRTLNPALKLYAMSITAWVLHPGVLVRPTSETTHGAENQAGSLHCRCCLPLWCFAGHRSSGSGLHSPKSSVSLPAST